MWTGGGRSGGVLGGTYGQPRVWGRVRRVSGLHRLAEGGWMQSGVESRSRLVELSPTVAPKGRGMGGGAQKLLTTTPLLLAVGTRWAGCGVKFNHPLCMTTYPAPMP